jgi:glycerol uptake facilitator-like aquaporin
VTIARMFSDTFAGITPASVPAFVLTQIIGAAVGAALAVTLYPDARSAAEDIVVPSGTRTTTITPTERTTP